MQKIKLTQTVQKGGCAAKIAASELRKILAQVKFPPKHEALMVDGGLFDDAAIYKVNSEIALVQTLDFFTPIVDSPEIFGQIAAANALSDIYAMGGQPKTAMAILAFPLAVMDNSVVVDVLQGASSKVQQAKANFVGGHSIDDDTLKFGLSVTGFIHPEKIWSNAGAKPGQVLILTKALGTGALTAGLKRQVYDEAYISEALQSMCQLNNILDFLDESLVHHISAATDITGFGLSGHSLQLAKASQVQLCLNFNKLPILANAMDCLEKGFLTKAHRTNAEYTADRVNSIVLSNLQKLLINDPQTSGGLLLSVNAEAAADILKSLKNHFNTAAIVGHVEKQNEQADVIFSN
jgi:selenide, water dikinase